MNFKEYQGLARRTQNMALNDEKKRNHALLGIGSELVEIIECCPVDTEYIADELGDFLWFIAELCDVAGIDMSNFVAVKGVRHGVWAENKEHMEKYGDVVMRKFASLAIIHMGKILGMGQKVYQGHSLDKEKLEAQLMELIRISSYLAWYVNENGIEGVMQHNIDKLVKRYPDGFSEYRSVNREEYIHE